MEDCGLIGEILYATDRNTFLIVMDIDLQGGACYLETTSMSCVSYRLSELMHTYSKSGIGLPISGVCVEVAEQAAVVLDLVH